MPRFIYIGGTTKTEHCSEMPDGKGGMIYVDERKGVDLPDVTFAFAHKFIIGQPTDVRRDAFPSEEHFRQALSRLEKHPHFKPFAEDTSFEMVETTTGSGGGSQARTKLGVKSA